MAELWSLLYREGIDFGYCSQTICRDMKNETYYGKYDIVPAMYSIPFPFLSFFLLTFGSCFVVGATSIIQIVHESAPSTFFPACINQAERAHNTDAF